MTVKIKDVLHYGGGVIMVVVGGLAEVGVHFTGINVESPEMVIAGGLGILGVGAKVDHTNNKIAAGLMALAAFLFVAPSAAYAADLMPTKAQAKYSAAPCTTLDCSGFMVGANLVGTGSNLDIIGSGINGSVFSGGGLIGLDAGGQLWNGQYFAGAMASLDLDANVSSNVHSGRYLAMGLFQLGVGLSGIFNPVSGNPGPGPITIPQQIAGALLSPYVEFGVAIRPRGTAWVSGAGAEFRLSDYYALRLDYLHLNYAHDNVSTMPIGVVDQSNVENLVKATLLRKL